MKCEWQSIGHGLDAKFRDSNSIWLRNSNQQSDYPCLIIETDGQRNITNIYTPDNSHAGSVDSRIWIISLVKEYLRNMN